MKKVRTILSLVLAVLLCLSMCACSLTDMVSGATYNTGKLKDGYSKVSSVDGVDFVVPSEMKDEAMGEMEFMGAAMEAATDEKKAAELEKKTFEVKTSSVYMLANYSKAIFMVAPTILDDSLDTVEDADDLEKILDVEDEVGVKIGNSYSKTNVDGVVKVICPATFEFGEDQDLTKEYEYTGYIALIENSDEDVYMMICGSVEKDDDTMKYVAKSLAYNGEELSEEDEDEDVDIDWEIDEDDIELGDGVTLKPSDDEDKDEDEDVPSTTTKPENTEKPSTQTNGNVSSDWTKLDVAIDGVVYTFPYDYAKLKSNGWSFDLAKYGKENGYLLNPGDKIYSTIELNNSKYGSDYDDFSITCGFKNYDTVVKDVTECDLWSISMSADYGSRMKTSYANVEIAKGIKFGSTAKEVLAVFGTPRDTYEASDLGYKVYTFEKDSIKARLRVSDQYGLVEIEYQNYD